MDGLIQSGGFPTGTGVGLIGLVSLVETQLGRSNELFCQLLAHHKFGLVGLRPSGGIAGLGNLGIA